MGSEEQIQAQAAVVLTLVDSTVRCTVLKGSLTELNDQADDLANLLVSVANSGEPPFKEDARIASLTEEVERVRGALSDIETAFVSRSEMFISDFDAAQYMAAKAAVALGKAQRKAPLMTAIDRRQAKYINAEQAKEIAWEAFELGAKFQFFIHSSHCWDGRDLARFFGCDGHPEWSAMAGVIYQSQTTACTPKDDGICIGKRALRDAMRLALDKLPALDASARPAEEKPASQLTEEELDRILPWM